MSDSTHVTDINEQRLSENLKGISALEHMEEDAGILIRADVVDGEGDFFPRAVLEEAVEQYRKALINQQFITTDYSKMIEGIRGWPTDIVMEGNDVKVTAQLDEQGIKMRKLGAEYAIGGIVHKSHIREDGVRVIDKMDIREVALCLKRIPLEKPTLDAILATSEKKLVKIIETLEKE